MSGKNETPQSKRPQDNRPLSPHLTIYKPQITSILSITHRATGVALFVGSLLLAWWIVMNVYGCQCLNALIFSVPGKTLLVLWTLALYYHMLNGIRHLFWDIGKGFEMKTVRASGVAVLVGTVILTLISWYAGQLL